MQEITLSLNDNNLKISTVEKGEFKGISAFVGQEVAKDEVILNLNEFSNIVRELISQLTHKSGKDLALNVVIEPQDIFVKFITVNKKEGEVEDQIVNEIKTRNKEVNLDDLYYSYFKIAPFVYQFVGIRKFVLDSYLTVANTLGLSIRSIVPWLLLLPKFTQLNEPAIYLSKVGNGQVVALSEFNSIFYTGVFETEKTTEDLQKLVRDLSVYKRTKPINKVFVYNCDSFTLNPEYEVLKVEMPNSEAPESKGYEIHLLLNYLINKDKSLLVTEVNMLNLLRVPVVLNKNNNALVYAGSFAALLLVVGLVFGGSYIYKSKNTNLKKTTPATNQTQILGNQIDTQQTSPSNQPVVTPEKPVLNKKDLKIRVENGAGIPGIAGRTQEFLNQVGYTVVSIGNSNSNARETTLININLEKKDYLELLTKDMKDQFKTETEQILSKNPDYDVLITVGSDAKL